MEVPLRKSTRPFPSYAHRPGTTPHPINDPRGHSYHNPGAATHPFPAVMPDAPSLPASETYRYAIDLYNAGFWWEAHEEWESLWLIAKAQPPAAAHIPISAPPTNPTAPPTANFLRGLIQSAAFQLKLSINERPGCQRLLARLSANFAPVIASIQPSRHFAGVDVVALLRSLQSQLPTPGTLAEPFEFIVLASPSAPAPPQ